MKRRGFTLIELIVVIVIIGILAAILFPVFQRTHHGDSRRSACQTNLKQIGLAIVQYSQDNNEKMPLVAVHGVASSTAPSKTPYGWADAVRPYLKRTQIFQCPTEATKTEGSDGVRVGFTDYWINTNVSGVRNDKLKFLTTTLLCGDGNDGTKNTNARYSLKNLPQAWRTSEGSPAQRHYRGANYLFADGHVKFVQPERIQNKRTKASDYSFAAK